MSVIIPQSDLYLLKVPIEIDNRNQLTFTTATAQYNYFNSLTKHTNPEQGTFTYQRQDGTVRYPACIDDIRDYNYCMYRNDGYSNKWFYCFITDMKYLNDKTTAITLKTDVWQTWMFDITIMKSFVEREHVNTDTIGSNTIPENLELGEYKVNSHLSDSFNNSITNVLASTVDPDSLTSITGGIFGGIPSGIRYYRYDTIGTPSDVAATTLLGAINRLNNNGKADAISGLFIAPKWIAGGSSTNIPIANTTTPESKDLGISRISTLDGYIPKNKKLLTFPYCFIEVSNNIGQATTFMQERWTLNAQDEMVLRMQGCLTPGGSIRCYPVNYNGDGEGFDDGISLGKFPALNWITDHYTNWLTQNGISLGAIKLNAKEAGLLGSAINIGVGATRAASGDVTGGLQVGEGIGGIFSTMQSNYQHSLIPNTASGNLNSGDITTAMGANRFHCYRKTITNEYAKIIDNYFDMFGYKVNDLKTPNVNGRTNWNYVKTIGCNIESYIPQYDLQEIKNMFNTGVTFWHNPSTFLDYSQSNSIV